MGPNSRTHVGARTPCDIQTYRHIYIYTDTEERTDITRSPLTSATTHKQQTTKRHYEILREYKSELAVVSQQRYFHIIKIRQVNIAVLCLVASVAAGNVREKRGFLSGLHSAPAYSAPAVSYSAPSISYSAPAISYSPPAVSYAAAPAVSYSAAPSVSYAAAPSVSYAAAPSVSYAAAPAVSYATAPAVSYSAAPAARLVTVNKVVNVNRVVSVPQVVNVRKVVSVPQVVTVNKLVPAAAAGW
ncbi:hypothetical protein RR46_14526 [Papilio xuthus]|uniref:Uncharacterized protein n=1 Tax=Papilio xuthus TaxID=66420 RepID=A0A194PCS5_PAPXU|nr:hypothetical protein RR46_14526 [Papilio xuthus]